MPVHRYVEENSSAPMLAAKRSVGVMLERNLGECVACMPLPSVNKSVHYGFETQRKCNQKSKTWVSVAPQKELMFPDTFFSNKGPVSTVRQRQLFRQRSVLFDAMIGLHGYNYTLGPAFNNFG